MFYIKYWKFQPSLTAEQVLRLFDKRETMQLASYREEEERLMLGIVVVAGRHLARNVKALAWMTDILPKTLVPDQRSHHSSTYFTQPPIYCRENYTPHKLEILAFMQNLHLTTTAHTLVNSDEKAKYIRDFERIKRPISKETDVDKIDREEAEERLEDFLRSKGSEMIITVDHQGYSNLRTARRLGRAAATALEKFRYCAYFRMGGFHTKLNKVSLDTKRSLCGLDINSVDVGSLGHLNGLFNLKLVVEDKKIRSGGQFEVQDQGLTCVGFSYLTSAMEAYLTEVLKGKIGVNKDLDGATKIILGCLNNFKILVTFKAAEVEKASVDDADDLRKTGRLLAAQALVSEVGDYFESTGDAMGLRGLNISLISYFLGRKKIKADAKYAAALLSELLQYQAASPRVRQRLDNTAVAWSSSAPDSGIFRDMKQEVEVKKVQQLEKRSQGPIRHVYIEEQVKCFAKDLKLHYSLQIRALCVTSQILEHDRASMLTPKRRSRSYDYIGEEKRARLQKYVCSLQAFSTLRECPVTFSFVSVPSSIFANCTPELESRFLSNQATLYKEQTVGLVRCEQPIK